MALLSRIAPSSVQTTVSSIRTPRLPGKVDPRLVAEGHPGLQRQLVALDKVGLLVNFEPKAVPDAVQERLAVTGIGDHLARSPVEFLQRHARLDRLERRLVGLQHDLVDTPVFLGRRTDVHGPGHIRVVAIQFPAPVEDRPSRLPGSPGRRCGDGGMPHSGR